MDGGEEDISHPYLKCLCGWSPGYQWTYTSKEGKHKILKNIKREFKRGINSLCFCKVYHKLVAYNNRHWLYSSGSQKLRISFIRLKSRSREGRFLLETAGVQSIEQQLGNGWMVSWSFGERHIWFYILSKCAF